MANDPLFVVKLLRFASEHDIDIHWNASEDGGVECFATCSDTFAWATADCEAITPETFPVLQKCIGDLLEAGGREAAAIYGSTLYAARMRKQKPMQYWMKNPPSKGILKLFERVEGPDGE